MSNGIREGGEGSPILRWDPIRGHDNGHGDEIPVDLAGRLEVSVRIDSNVHGGVAAALHLQDLLHILGDGIPNGGSHR